MISYKKDYENNYQNYYGPSNGFTKYYIELLKNKNLSGAEIRLLSTLINLSSMSKEPYVKNYVEFLIFKSNLTKSSFYRAIKKLQDLGYIDYTVQSAVYKASVLYKIKEPNKWLKVYDRVWYYPCLNYSDGIVYSYLLMVSGLKQFKNRIYVTLKKIAEYSGLSISVVSKTIKKLDSFNLISVKKDNSIQINVYLNKAQPEELEWKNKLKEYEEKEDKYGDAELQEKLDRYKDQRNKSLKKKFYFDDDSLFNLNDDFNDNLNDLNANFNESFGDDIDFDAFENIGF